MIVGAGDHGQVERVGELEKLRTPLLQHTDPPGRAITQLHGVESRVAFELVRRQHRQIAGNRENEDRSRRGDCERGVANRIVPVTFRVEHERRVDSDRDDVLVLVACFEAGQQRGAFARARRIVRQRSLDSIQILVIRDIRDVEAGRRVPVAIAFRREPLACIPGMVRVTVEVDHHVVRVRHRDRGHRPRNYRTASVHRYDPCERDECRPELRAHCRPASERQCRTPHQNHEQCRCEHRIVLPERKQRQCVEDRADRRQHRVGRRVDKRCAGRGAAGFRVQNGARAHQRGPEDQDEGERDCDGLSGWSHRG